MAVDFSPNIVLGDVLIDSNYRHCVMVSKMDNKSKEINMKIFDLFKDLSLQDYIVLNRGPRIGIIVPDHESELRCDICLKKVQAAIDMYCCGTVICFDCAKKSLASQETQEVFVCPKCNKKVELWGEKYYRE